MLSKLYELITSLVVGLTRLIGKTTYMLMAIKAMITTALTVGLGTMLYNFVVRIINELFVYIMGILQTTFTASMPSLTYEFVGLGAYLFQSLRLGECLAIVMAAVVVSWLLAFIPFVGKH
jgi:hypothetical protein